MVELIQQIEIDAPIGAVWAEITKLGTVQRPLLDTVLATTLEPGAPLRYTTPDGRRTFVVGRVVEADVRPSRSSSLSGAMPTPPRRPDGVGTSRGPPAALLLGGPKGPLP